jgi:acetylornithine deacetylase/succinyl-diaminopimelate desuccinylase family protein
MLVSDVVSLLADLVKIPSVCGEEGKIANFIADWLEKNRLQVETLDVKPNRPDVIARLKGPKAGPRILLNGHMDTVDPGRGWIHDPFGAQVEGGKMFGRGTFDMKSGLACILWAAAACKEESLPKRGELIVTAVVDEEAIDWGTYALVQKGITKDVDFAMVSESTDLEIATAHRGRAVFEVEVHGRSAHSQWPEHGVNAIEKAAVLLNALPRIGGPQHPRLGSSTINTLKIEGGQEEVMLVPDYCRLVIDRCLVPGYTSTAALKDLQSLITETGIEAETKLVERETPFCEPFEIPDDHPYVRLIAQAAAKTLGRTPKITYHGGPCDSCILVNQGRIPTIEFGPSGARLHESDEYVEIESVRKTAAVYVEIARTLLS